MIADSERREAAERLNGYVSEWRDMPNFSVQKGVACSLGIARFDVESQLLRLADLIDPDCEEGRYSVARTARPVDRDALLSLAEDVDEAAAMAVAMDSSTSAKLLADMLLDIARRIREALGVEDDLR